MSNIKANLCGVTACLSTLAFSGGSFNPNETANRLLNLDNLSITSGLSNSLNTGARAKVTHFNLEEIVPLIDRLNSLHESSSITDQSLHDSLSRKLFEKLKDAFPSQTSGYPSYSGRALVQMLTQSLPRELNKANLCFVLSSKEGKQVENSLRSTLLSLYRIDSIHQSEVEVMNELPLRGDTIFVTPLTKRITGDFSKKFLIADNASNICIVDVGNHLTSPTLGDFVVQEPGIDYKTKKSDLVERFGYGTDGITYQEQAIRHTLFDSFTRNFLTQKGYVASDNLKQTASELYIQFRLLFKGELPGYTWAKILQRNSEKPTSPKSIASTELFTAVSDSFKEELSYKRGSVTAKLINAFKNENVKSKLYDRVLEKIFDKYTDLKVAVKAKADQRRSQKYDLTGEISPESNTISAKPDNNILAVITLGTISVIGFLNHLRKKNQDRKLIHIDKIPPTRKPETATSKLPQLSPYDAITNELFNDIKDLKELEELIGMPRVLSQIAEEAIGDENFQVSEEILQAAYIYLNTPNENYQSMALCFLKVIYDLQRNGLVPANIGGNNLIVFESMNDVTFDDWINIGYPIYKLIRDKNLSFHQITLRQLAYWGDSNGPQRDTLSFLHDALRNDTPKVANEVLSSWWKLIENIRLGCFGFRLSEQVPEYAK